MTTMPSWLTDAEDAVTAASDSARMQLEVETLIEAQRNLSTPLARLTRLDSARSAGGGTWFVGHTAPPAVFDALKAAARAPSQGSLGTLSRKLNAFVPAAEERAMADWRSYGSRRMGAVTDLLELVRTLAGVVSVAQLAAALQDVLRKLMPATNELPTAAAFSLLDEAEERLKALEAALQPDAVRQFLSAVARGGAPLSMLTDDVRAWIAANMAERSFKLVAGTPVVE